MAKAIVVTTPKAQPPIRLKIPFMIVWLEWNRACGQGELEMRGLKLSLGSVVAASLLAACLEAQPAPDVPQRPSAEFDLIEIASGLDRVCRRISLSEGRADCWMWFLRLILRAAQSSIFPMLMAQPMRMGPPCSKRR